MKFFQLFIFTGFYCFPGTLLQAQPGTDSLRALVSDYNTSDAKKIQASIQLAGNIQLKDFGENLLYGHQGLLLAKQNKDSVSQGILYNNIGKAHYFNGDYDSATFFYQKAISTLQQMKADIALADACNNIAKLYRKIRELPRAHDFYKKAFAIYTKQKNNDGIATIYNEEGVVYEYEGNYPQAIKNYTASLRIRERLKDSVGIAYALNFIGGAYAMMQQFDEAISYNQQALSIREQMKDTFTIALSNSDIGVVYAMQGNYAKARESLEKSNAIARSMRYPDLILNNLKQLSDIASDEKNYDKAYWYEKEYNLIKDSIYKTETSKQIQEFAARFETAEKEKRIQEQEFAIARRNYWITGATVALLLTILLGYSWYRRYQLKQAAILQKEIIQQRAIAAQNIIEAEEKERKRIAAELHDGVGQTMSAASMNLSALKDSLEHTDNRSATLINKVHAMVDDSCREIRMVSHNLMPHALNDKNLAAAVKDFTSKIDSAVLPIYLHSEGFDNTPATPTESVLYRVIQEIVNNILRHAGASRSDISIIKTKTGIEAIIEDDGAGFNMASLPAKRGLGLQNIQSRIDWLQGQVEWDTAPGRGTVVSIYIPLSA